MAERIYPGATLGIIGSSYSAAVLAQVAGALGYRVASLVTDENNPVRQFASWQTVTESYNERALDFFSTNVDIVMSGKNILSNQSFQILAANTYLPLSDDLIAITTDRLIEKAYLDSINLLVTPFSLITNIHDLREAIDYIGYPCILKATQRHTPYNKDHIILYGDEDLHLAQKRLDETTCILEAWIPSEKQVSITVVRNERGEILIYPIFEVRDQGDDLGKQVRYPAQISTDVDKEIRRIALHLTESLHLIGALTIKMMITSAGVVYINQASIGLDDEALFSIGAMSVSIYEAAARAIFGLPLPSLIVEHKAAISLPIANLNQEKLMTQFMLRTDWSFIFFNPMSNHGEALQGQVIITGDSLADCDRQIQITELTQ